MKPPARSGNGRSTSIVIMQKLWRILTFAIVTGVLNHWSGDEVADLHAADLALQDALLIAPGSMRVRGAQCQILRAMRQFEAGVKACSELAQSFPTYAFLHKEIGYDELMMGQLNEALAEFLEADTTSAEFAVALELAAGNWLGLSHGEAGSEGGRVVDARGARGAECGKPCGLFGRGLCFGWSGSKRHARHWVITSSCGRIQT